SVCGPSARRGEDGGAVPGVRDLPQDRLQDLQSLQGLWAGWPDGSLPTALPACPPAALSDREGQHPAQAGAPRLGGSEDPREALANTKALYAFTVFERAFKDFGLPAAIRTDNGAPFASANSLFGLTRLSVWWLRLGIDIERIKPGHPQQNGRHERMHLTLKQEATKPASKNFLQQQARFDQFISTFNQERPHEALNMRYPVGFFDHETCRIESAENPFAPKPMGWSLPSPKRHRCAKVDMHCVHFNGKGSDHDEHYCGRVRPGKECVSGAWRGSGGPRKREEAAQAGTGGGIFCQPAAVSSGHGSLF